MSSLQTPQPWLGAGQAPADKARPVVDASTLASIVGRLGLRFDAAVVVVGGTNGKSSVAAMLEAIAIQAGYRVGVQSSSHLVRFEERCRLHGEVLTAARWQPHWLAVDEARDGVALSPDTFATLAALHALTQQPLDLVVLEAGAAAEAIATLIDADCCVLTSIDAEHCVDDREAVGARLTGLLRAPCTVVLGDPLPPAHLLSWADALDVDVRLSGRDFRFGGDRQQWSWSGRDKRFNALAYPALRGANQLLNASAALAAFESLRERLPISAQAVRTGLAVVELPGRFQIVPGQPALVLDIASNPHAAAALVQNLDQMGFHPRTQAVLGALKGADVGALLTRLAPVVDGWHFADLPADGGWTGDAWRATELAAAHARLGLRGPGPVSVGVHASASAALSAAIAASDPTDRILAFGSAATIGDILRHGVPRLSAPHAS